MEKRKKCEECINKICTINIDISTLQYATSRVMAYLHFSPLFLSFQLLMNQQRLFDLPKYQYIILCLHIQLYIFWRRKRHTLAFINSGVIVRNLHHWSVIIIGLYRVNVLIVWIICVHHHTQLWTCKKIMDAHIKKAFGNQSLKCWNIIVWNQSMYMCNWMMLNTSMYLTDPTYFHGRNIISV